MAVEFGGVDTDDLGVALLDDTPQSFPLCVVVSPLEREEAVVIEAPDRNPFHAPIAAAVGEDENRAPARRIGRYRPHGAENGIVVVCARDGDPHGSYFAAHSVGADRV